MITCSGRKGDWWTSAHAPQRYVHVGFAFFQCILGAGIIFGWYGTAQSVGSSWSRRLIWMGIMCLQERHPAGSRARAHLQ